MASQTLLALDIGTTSAKFALVENNEGKPLLKYIAKLPSQGVEKGTVHDIAEVSQVINRAFGEAKKVSKYATRNVYVNLGTHQAKCQNSRGIVAVSRADAEIYQDDVDRVIRASQAINFAPNWVIVHHIPREYIVDNIGDIQNPLGLSGSRLEVSSLLITAFSKHIKDIMRAVEVNGGHLGGVVFGPLAASRATLSKKQRHLGTAVLDMGAGTTGVSVYEGNKLLGTAVVPMGAGHITNDIAVGLKIPIDVAEKVKLMYGYAVEGEIGAKEIVDLKKCDSKVEGSLSRRFVANIIEARLAEILDLVDNELKVITKAVRLPGGAVLVGGGAKMPGLSQLVRERLKLSSQVGLALTDEWAKENPAFDEYFEDPEFVNVLGLVLSGADKEDWTNSNQSKGFGPKVLVKFAKYFMP